MASVQETLTAKTQLGSGLADGVNTISGNETIIFTLYVKLILPLDGYVYWVNASLLTDTAIYNAAQYNFSEFNNKGDVLPAKQLSVQGSFHYNTEMHQLEDRTVAYNHLLFTTPQLVKDFNLVSPNLIYVASYEQQKFSFSRRDNYYRQADMYHYRGDSLYSIMNTQLINSMTDFDPNSVVVSNSLPIWLTLNQFFPMYPSYLVGQNITPPFASVDIPASSTTPLQQFPLVDAESNPYQLTHDTVKISIFGLRNHDALNFVQYVFQYSLNTDNIGMMNMPIIQDEKVTQPEFGIIAMKKSITFEVSYYQKTVNNIARKLIESAFINLNSI